MKHYAALSVLALALCAAPALAQQSPSTTWGSSPGWKSANQEFVDLQLATAIKAAQNGSLNTGTTVNYQGPVNFTTTYNGTVNNQNQTSTTTTAVNLTNSSSTVSNTGSGDVTVGQTIDNQSGTATQDASATISKPN